ncbi:MAG: hypothetical protein B6I36_10930 [Desulfobacteraceae bacterium 4572_35.1]|nr:MAG: hypothetical protein B6I36_10930 [Desulfobacteraceae bacterium 4572_35.1]
MERCAIHICLVSKQLLPNLLLCCDENRRPEKVILIVTAAMWDPGHWLADLICQQGCRVEIVETASYDVVILQQLLSDLLTQYSASTIAVNVTGGNKLMAMAAFLESWSRNLPTFYIDTASDTLWLLGERSQQFPLPDLLKVKLYLQAYGYSLVSCEGKSIPELVDDCDQWSSSIKALNCYASMANKSLSQLQRLLEKFEGNGLLSLSGDRLVFANESSRVYSNGGWLEQHVFGVVQQLKLDGRIRDVTLNGVIEDPRGVKNEIDVMFTARNRLFLIECKTKNMNLESSRVDDMVYKLESLKGLVGGLFGQAMVVSYLPVPSADRKRCRSYGIELVDGRKVKELRSQLCQWIDR